MHSDLVQPACEVGYLSSPAQTLDRGCCPVESPFSRHRSEALMVACAPEWHSVHENISSSGPTFLRCSGIRATLVAYLLVKRCALILCVTAGSRHRPEPITRSVVTVINNAFRIDRQQTGPLPRRHSGKGRAVPDHCRLSDPTPPCSHHWGIMNTAEARRLRQGIDCLDRRGWLPAVGVGTITRRTAREVKVRWDSFPSSDPPGISQPTGTEPAGNSQVKP